MARWDSKVSGRLTAAALELFTERGYQHTSITDITERAGVSERTFGRYFADKPDVLFDSSNWLEEAVTAAVAHSDQVRPLDIMIDALAVASARYDDHVDFVRRRLAVIDSHPALRAREAVELARFGSFAARALRDRGVSDTDATIAADVGMAVAGLAFTRWVRDEQGRPLAVHVRACARRLAADVEVPSDADAADQRT